MRQSSQSRVGQALHEYDLQLCEYVIGTICQNLDDKRFADYLQKHFPEDLLKYIEAKEGDRVSLAENKQERLSLSDDEFLQLDYFFLCAPFQVTKEWLPDEWLHKRYVETLTDVRDNLSIQTAEDWARKCVEFGTRLEAGDLYLREGIVVVSDWVYYLRGLLRSMKATAFLPPPDGQQLTPTTMNAAGEVESETPEKDEGDNATVGSAAERYGDGKDTQSVREEAVVPTMRGDTLPPEPKKNYLISWSEILNAVDVPNNKDGRNKVRKLNKAFDGPINLPKQGGQPRVEKRDLLKWWDEMYTEFHASNNHEEGRQEAAKQQYLHGKAGTVAPELSGHVHNKKHRGN